MLVPVNQEAGALQLKVTLLPLLALLKPDQELVPHESTQTTFLGRNINLLDHFYIQQFFLLGGALTPKSSDSLPLPGLFLFFRFVD